MPKSFLEELSVFGVRGGKDLERGYWEVMM